MDYELYRPIIEKAPLGFACHKIIYDANSIPIDFEYLEVNSAFLRTFGLEGRSITGKKASELFPEGHTRDSWIDQYIKTVCRTGEASFEQYTVLNDSWFRVNAYSHEEGAFISWLTDITREKKDLEERQVLMSAISDIIFIIDDDSVIKSVMAADDSKLFAPREAIIGQALYKFLPEQLYQILSEAMQKVKTAGEKEYVRYQSPVTGDERWYEASISLTEWNDRNDYVISVNEISAQKKMEAELQQKTEELERFFNISLDLLCIADLEGNFIKVNMEWERILGYTAEELEKRKFLEFVHPDDMEATLAVLAKLSNKEQIINFVNRFKTIDGSYHYIEWRSQPYGEYVYASARDITDRVLAEEKIVYLSIHDQLTGIYNRRFYELELLKTDQPSNLPLSLVMADVNGLKAANDKYGHMIGDRLLKTAAEIMKKESRDSDIVCRIGGDEFVIILPNTGNNEAEIFVKRMEEAMKNTECDPIEVSVAFGWASKEQPNEKIEDVFKKAEVMMYIKKSLRLSDSAS